MTTLNVSYKKGLPLFEKLAKSIRLFDHDVTKLLLDEHPYLVNQTAENGKVAIHQAIHSRNLTALNLILTKPNVDLTEQSQEHYNTPLIAAIATKDIDFVHAILNNVKSLETFKIRNNICLNALSATIYYDFKEAFDIILNLSPDDLIKRIDCYNNTLVTKLIQFQKFDWLHTGLKYYQISQEDVNHLKNHRPIFGICDGTSQCPNKVDKFSSRYFK